MRYLASLLLVGVLLAGCATPQNSEQAVFQMRGDQNVFLRAAVEYKRLTPCQAPAKQPCSDKAIVGQLQKADRVSDQALEAAESAVRTPGFGESIVSSAVTAAKAALAAFESIVATLGSK